MTCLFLAGQGQIHQGEIDNRDDEQHAQLDNCRGHAAIEEHSISDIQNGTQDDCSTNIPRQEAVSHFENLQKRQCCVKHLRRYIETYFRIHPADGKGSNCGRGKVIV